MTDLYPGRNEEARALELQVGNKTYKRAIQHLIPNEIIIQPQSNESKGK